MEEKELSIDCTKGLCFPSASTISSISVASLKKSHSSRAGYMTDGSLGPDNKYNKSKRLYNSKLHFDKDPMNYDYKKQTMASICQLHNWFGGVSRQKILFCPVCEVSFCPNCYKRFHTEPDIDWM